MFISFANRCLNTTRSRHAADYEVNKHLLRAHLPSAPVIVEAGAHIGSDTLEMGAVWPKGEVHAFEPVPSLFFRLSRNTFHMPRVFRYPLALADARGWVTLNVSSGASDASSSLLKPKGHLESHPEVHFVHSIHVATISLDEWSRAWGVPRVDLLWLDLQGAELQALKGGENLLASVSVVYTEVSLTEVYEGGCHYWEIRSYLESRGFRVEKEFLPFADSGNVLFVRTRQPR